MRPFASNVKSCVIPPWTFTSDLLPFGLVVRLKIKDPILNPKKDGLFECSFSEGRLICPLSPLPPPHLYILRRTNPIST